jgi:hypothetical protein
MGSCRQRRRPLRTSSSGLQLHNNVIRIRHFISMDFSLYGYGYEEGGCPVPSRDILGLESFASNLRETHTHTLVYYPYPMKDRPFCRYIIFRYSPAEPSILAFVAFTLYNCLYFSLFRLFMDPSPQKSQCYGVYALAKSCRLAVVPFVYKIAFPFHLINKFLYVLRISE